MKKVSVVLPTYNRLDQVKQVLNSFAIQTCEMHEVEIIVISDGSTDGTDVYFETATFPFDLIYIRQENAGPAAARNRGINEAQGEFVLFIDDDVVPTPNLIAAHLQSHAEHGRQVVVLGPMLSPARFKMTPWVQWEQTMLYKQYAEMEAGLWAPTARQFYTGNASLRRQHLVDAGGFDTTFRRAEDVELAYRLAENGLHFIFEPQAIGYHYVRRHFSSWLQTPYLYGRNDVIFSRDKGQSWLEPTVIKEFQSRHLLIKTVTKLCLSRPRISNVVVLALKQVASLESYLRWLSPKSLALSRVAYSGIYNLRYYQGFVDELGGRQHFFRQESGVN